MATLDEAVGKKLGPQDFFDITDIGGISAFHFDFERKFDVRPWPALDIWMRHSEGNGEWYKKFSEVKLARFFYNGHKIEVRFAPIGTDRPPVHSFDLGVEHRAKISMGTVRNDEFYAYISYGLYPRIYSDRTDLLVKTHPKMEMR